jgi:microcystin-dependent protein
MAAVYPGAVRAFTTKIDLEMTVFALHMNDVQDEIAAVQNVLGTNPQGAATGPATVGKRITDLETGKSATTHDHTNRLDVATHDIELRHTFGAAYGNPATPAPIVVGAAGSPGTGDNPAKEDHAHPLPSALALGATFLPPGMIVAYGGTTAPAGWVFCDGASLLRTTPNDALFAAIGVRYGAADGTHFNVPELRSRFPMGAATTGAAITTGGFADAQLPSHNHPGSSVSNGNADHGHYVDHTHGTGDSGNHSHSFYPGWSSGAEIVMVSVGGPNNWRIGDADDPVQGPFLTFGRAYDAGNHNHGNTGSMNGRTGTDGASGAANHGHGQTIALEGVSVTNRNLPPYQTVNYIIKL